MKKILYLFLFLCIALSFCLLTLSSCNEYPPADHTTESSASSDSTSSSEKEEPTEPREPTK